MRKIIPMMLASLLYPAAGYSLGMGEIRLHSGLNQPLSAEIDLLSVGNEDVTTISAGLASSELFAQLGIDRSSTLLLVTFEVQKRANGAFYIKATSKQPIREPYLDFLLEVNWKSGHALREYTVLLDPPEFAKQAPVTIQPPAEAVTAPLPTPVSAEQPATDTTAQTPETAAKTAEGAPTPEQAAQPADEQKVAEAPAAEATAANDEQTSPAVAITAEANVAPTEATKIEEPAAVAGAPAKSGVITYGPVRGDETLWSIAKRIRPNRSVTVPQVMSALVHQNPYAFYGKNANRMKAGHVLRLDPAQLAEISREEAAREIALQGRDWHDYKQRAATQAGTRAPTTGTESQESSAVAAAKKEEPRLKLVTPQEGGKPSDKMAAPGTSATDADALRKELMLAIETSEAQKQENEELRKRLQELEGQVAAMQRLLSLKDNDLAALQRQAGQAGEKSAPAKGGVTQPPAVVVAPVPVPSQPAAAPAQPTTAPAAGAEQKAPATSAPAATTPPAAPEKKAPVAKTPPPPAPAQEPSLIGGILSNPVVLGVIAFCAVVVGVLGVVILRRRRSGASFQESILMGGSPSMLKAKATESGQKSGQKEETSFFSDFAVSGMSDIRAEDSEVDPLTEADVYMAYQRFQQAEELLREAMKQQDRPELHVKLLEVYHATRNKEAFEAEAMKIMPMLNGTGPLWEKVLVLGHELLPQHALFAKAPEKVAAAAGGHADARLDNEVLDIGLDLDALAEEMESGGAQDTGEFNLDLGVDFSDLETAKPAAASKTPAPSVPAAPAAAPAPAAAKPALPAAAAPKKEEAPLEFDLGDLDLHLDETPAAPPAAKQESKPTPAASGPEAIDFGALDLGDLELGTAGQKDEPLPAEDLNSPSLAGGGESNEIDLGDFDLGALDAEPAPAAKKAPESSLGDFDLSDLSEIQVEAVPNPNESEEENFFANLDEADTKLDLARAYMEMGDPDGARGILDEVVQEGNATQKQQAQELLKQIA